MSAPQGMIRITLIRSPIGRQPVQRKTVRALGLKKLHQSVLHKDTPEIAGMVGRVSHLVDVQPWEEEKEETDEKADEATQPEHDAKTEDK
jgi:large subunit ribosomal protein L30